MLFSFLSGSLGFHRQPQSARRKGAALRGSRAGSLPECAQELGEMGKARTGQKGPGGTREAVGGLSLCSPRASPPRPVWHKRLPGRQAAEQRPAPPRTRSFVGAKHKREGKKYVFRFDGGGQQRQDSWASQEPPEPGPLAPAKEHSISREGAVCARVGTAVPGTLPGCAHQAPGARPGQGPGRPRAHGRASAGGGL